jgi:hypothetical protein
LILFLTGCNQHTQSLKEKLQNLKGVVEVNTIETDTVFNEQYEVYFEQPIDHKNPSAGTFKQRVIVSHVDFNKPMVAVIEGYNIWNGRASELQKLMQCNQINIEHRFFKDSKPDSIPWDKLTIWQAATDQHIIIKELQKIYKQKWITTGISKGGQTTMYHRRFYPDDVTASVPYVAPLNFAREDPHIYKFLKTVGTDADREKIYNFQVLCFENFNELEKLLIKKSKEKKWSFKFGFKKALQYTILEYSFAFWQWGGFPTDQIPSNNATPAELFNHLNNVAGFTFFEDKGVEANRPFFWAALTEIGIYGYQTKPFAKYLGDTTDFTFDFTAPNGYTPVYNPKPMQEVKLFLDNKAENMLFIYGGLDTWGATAYHPSGKNNLVNMTLPNGHHGTRIKNFPKKDREYIYSLISKWMDVNINDIFEDK